MASPFKKGRPHKIKDPVHDFAPHVPGIYRIIKKVTNVIEYIGQTNDINRRQHEHKSSNKINEGTAFEWKKADGRFGSKALAAWEKKKIQQHNPILNKSRGGEGRPAKK